MLKDLYLKNSNIPLRYLRDIQLVADKQDKDAFQNIININNNINDFVTAGSNLFICSHQVGNGKTTIATKLLKSFINKNSSTAFPKMCPCFFIHVPSYLANKKVAMSDYNMAEKIKDIDEKIINAKIVVFDDIDTKQMSDYDANVLCQLINERVNNLRSCIYTSNILPDDMFKSIDARLYSRVVNLSKIIILKGGDGRTC